MRKKKRWTGWFRPDSPTRRVGPWLISTVRISPFKIESRAHKQRNVTRIMMTVPKACGNAVQRNKIKRLLYENIEFDFSKLEADQGIWIRLRYTHKLSKKLLLEDWVDSIQKLPQCVR